MIHSQPATSLNCLQEIIKKKEVVLPHLVRYIKKGGRRIQNKAHVFELSFSSKAWIRRE